MVYGRSHWKLESSAKTVSVWSVNHLVVYSRSPFASWTYFCFKTARSVISKLRITWDLTDGFSRLNIIFEAMILIYVMIRYEFDLMVETSSYEAKYLMPTIYHFFKMLVFPHFSLKMFKFLVKDLKPTKTLKVAFKYQNQNISLLKIY